jgi:hypothetical protein
MNRYSFCVVVVISAAGLAGISGARAEVNESPAPAQPVVKSDRPAPVPIPRPHPLAASRQSLPEQAAAAAASPPPQPSCDWFACARYVIVGMGF